MHPFICKFFLTMQHEEFDRWAEQSIKNIAPYLAENARDVTTNLLQLGPDQVAESLCKNKNLKILVELLGPANEVFEFIEQYNSKRFVTMKQWKKVASIPDETPKNTLIQKQNDQQICASNKKKQTNKSKKKIEKMEIVGNASLGFKGAPICECMATIHALVTNCLACGKIICEAELNNDTPYIEQSCPFCGSLIFNDKHEKFSNKAATIHKETLLDYDRNSTARTRVYDVASDFDAGQFDRWKSKEERESIRNSIIRRETEEEEEKKRRVITLDLENKTFFYEKSEDKNKEVDMFGNDTGIARNVKGVLRNPNLNEPPLLFISSQKSSSTAEKISECNDTFNRLQDDYNAL